MHKFTSEGGGGGDKKREMRERENLRIRGLEMGSIQKKRWDGDGKWIFMRGKDNL